MYFVLVNWMFCIWNVKVTQDGLEHDHSTSHIYSKTGHPFWIHDHDGISNTGTKLKGYKKN